MTKVLLYHPAIAADGKEFDRNHADRLLAMTDNGGWYEKEKTENPDNATNGPANTGKTKRAKAPKGARGRN